jgi:carboxypeptidase C (cathepsin A)
VKATDFHAFTKDIESVGEVIRLWISRNGRWLSPKFIAGESYGTTRAAALAEHLQSQHGMYLNGLMLISSVLDFGTGDLRAGSDRAFALYLPHYAAVAHYHGKHGRRSLRAVLDEAEAFASRDYPYALARGNRLPAAERRAAIETTARLVGLSEDYVSRADLRIEHWRYYGELLRDRGLTVGRIDSRFTGPAASGIAELMDADPSIDAIVGPYTAAYQHYVRRELGYESDLAFRTMAPLHLTWSYKEFEGRPVYVADKLERAMRQNPHLRVHFAYGYYDGATPYFAAEDVVAHLNLPDSLRPNIEHAYYEAGHMMYIHEPSRLQQSADLAAFVTRSSGRLDQ